MAVGTIPASTLQIGGTSTVDASGYFSDADGDELSYAGASSNEDVATVAMEGSSATITAVAAGDAVITITASDEAASVSQGFRIEVSSGPKQATVTVFDIKSVADNSIVDPSNVSDDVYVVLDVQANDETVTGIALTLGDETIHCRGSSADQGASPGLAASGGTEYNCLFNTDAIMGECTGEQLAPMYANGEHHVGAFITTADGERRDAAAALPVTLKNNSYVDVVHHAGKSVRHDGRVFHGGPSGEGNMNSFSACPVSYEGTVVGSLTLEAKRTDTDQMAADGPTVSFQTGKAEPDNDPSPTLTEAPYTWTIHSEFNASVETMAGDEFWVVNSGSIMDDAGNDVTDEFRKKGEAMEGPLHFDFKAPTLADDAEIQVAKKTIAARTSYSGGKIDGVDADFSLMGAMDMGVGVNNAMTKFAVGDCKANETDATKVDRTKVGFMAIEGYEDVSGIADLAEEDAARNAKTDKTDVDCYVAEPSMLVDGLGNAWKGGKTPASWLQTDNFGVDRTDPEISSVQYDDGEFFNGSVVIAFEVDNPTGEDGSTDSATGLSGMVTRPGATSSADPIEVTATVAPVGEDDDDDWTATVAGSDLPKDDTYVLTVTIQDGAMPSNKVNFEAEVVLDTKAPTFAGPEYMDDITGGASATIDVEGTLKDATSGIDEYTVNVFINDDGATAFCGAGDTPVPNNRLQKDFRKSGGKFTGAKGKGSKSIAIPAIAVKPPADLTTLTNGAESLCVEVSAEDRAGNSLGEADAAFVTVNWRANVPRILMTLGTATVDTIVEGAALPADLQIALGAVPTGEVTIEFASSNMAVLPAPADLIFAAATATTAVNVADASNQDADAATRAAPTSVDDDDASDEMVTITATAKGGGYDGLTASFDVLVTDNDWMLEVSDTEIERGGTTEVTVTLTRSESQKGSATPAPGTGATTDVIVTLVASHASISIPSDADAGTPGSQVSLDFGAGKTTATKNISVIVSSATPLAETVTLTVTGTTPAAVGSEPAGRFLPSAGTTIVIKEASGG